MANDSADVTSSGRSFQVYGPATGKARLPTVDNLLIYCQATSTVCLSLVPASFAQKVSGGSFWESQLTRLWIWSL